MACVVIDSFSPRFRTKPQSHEEEAHAEPQKRGEERKKKEKNDTRSR
ncbi:MAG: hypothetical protein GQF41_2870 [Candidatus Rifleibacterium amylolyticum]|nr:MAG: hypothetical protein GQF41_2870 [Candidatus Rifleibacterium amylolyticum]